MGTMTNWGIECRIEMFKKGISLGDLAEMTGYSRTYISSIINGRVIVPTDTMIKIGNTLGVDNRLIGT